VDRFGRYLRGVFQMSPLTWLRELIEKHWVITVCVPLIGLVVRLLIALKEKRRRKYWNRFEPVPERMCVKIGCYRIDNLVEVRMCYDVVGTVVACPDHLEWARINFGGKVY